jgi:hypothetical protein
MINEADGTSVPHSEFVPVLGYHLDRIDAFLGKLGTPIGVKSYKPYNSSGEDFLQNFIGMLGIPMDITPEFPTDEKMIFLTEQAKYDKTIVDKIKQQLINSKDVVITSGLYRALQSKGIEDIVELECTDKKVMTHQFSIWSEVYLSEKDILLPQMKYATNDSWELISAMDSGLGYPLLHQADYGKAKLYVLVIPDNFGELYELPKEVLTSIRQVLMKNLFVYTDSPANVSLFAYDNNSFILQSFNDRNLMVKIFVDKKFKKIADLEMNRDMDLREENDKAVFMTFLEPHGYKVYQVK